MDTLDTLVLDSKPDAGTPYDDWEDDEFNEGSWRIFELPTAEKEVMLIHSVSMLVDDMNDIDQGNPMTTWWFNGVGPVGDGDWTTKVEAPNFIGTTSIAKGTVGTGDGTSYAWHGGGFSIPYTKVHGGPLLNASGDITLCVEFLGAGPEIAWQVFYETMEVGDEFLLEELIEQANQSITRSRP